MLTIPGWELQTQMQPQLHIHLSHKIVRHMPKPFDEAADVHGTCGLDLGLAVVVEDLRTDEDLRLEATRRTFEASEW